MKAQFYRYSGAITSIFVTILGLVTLVFMIGQLLPADPVLAVIGPEAPPAQYEATRKAMGLDRPLAERYVIYLGNALTLDFGTSLISGEPVARDISVFLPATIELGLTSTILGGIVGTVFGMLAAANRNKWPDMLVRTIGLTIYSMPSFLLGLLMLLLFYVVLGWSPGPGRLSIYLEQTFAQRTGFFIIDTIIAGDWAALRNVLSHMALPLTVLAAINAAWFSRFVRTFALEEMGREYVLTARVKGLPERLVLWRHIFVNLRVQLVTISAVAIAGSLEGAVLLEAVFAWPGFGQYFVQALGKGDMNAISGCVMLTGLLFIIMNLAADRLYHMLDRRTQ
jgi:peptide/nickel transport system permease protein